MASHLGFDHFIGSSGSGKIWALAVVEISFVNDDGFCPDEATVAILIDPPKRHSETIAEILLRVYSEKDKSLSKKKIEKISGAVKFPEYQAVKEYLPQAPKSWLDLPAEIIVRFSLSEHACVGDSTFEEYSRNTLTDVLKVLFGPRHGGLLIHYSLIVREVTPLVKFDVDWPLLRRGKDVPFPRGKIQGDFPWDEVSDDTLISIYQYIPDVYYGWMPAPPYYGDPVVRLRVGGRSEGEAIANWKMCATALRKIKKEILIPQEL